MSDLATRTIKAGIAYFALVFGAGFVLGMIRVPFSCRALANGWPNLSKCRSCSW